MPPGMCPSHPVGQSIMAGTTKLRILALLCASLALASTLSRANLPEIPDHPLFSALAKGDVDAVHRLEQQLKAGPNTRNMDDVQLRYDLPHLLQEARICALHDASLGDAGGYIGALRCTEIVRASAIGLGDAREYFKEAAWARKNLFPSLSKLMNSQATFDNGLDAIDLDAIAAKTPAVTATWQPSSKPLAYPKVSEMPPSLSAPRPTIRINGQAITATVVTDQPTFTPVWITASPNDGDVLIKKLRLQPLVMGAAQVNMTYHATTFPARLDLYLAPSVEFGPLTLQHVAVVVVTTGYMPAEVLVGLPMLRQFGEVTITDDHMYLARQGTNACGPGVPMAFASSSSLEGEWKFPVSINGKAAISLIDTRGNRMVQLSPEMHDALNPKDPMAITIGAWTTHDLGPVAVSPNRGTGPDATVGNPLLKANSVHLRFDAPTPSICISPSAGAKT